MLSLLAISRSSSSTLDSLYSIRYYSSKQSDAAAHWPLPHRSKKKMSFLSTLFSSYWATGICQLKKTKHQHNDDHYYDQVASSSPLLFSSLNVGLNAFGDDQEEDEQRWMQAAAATFVWENSWAIWNMLKMVLWYISLCVGGRAAVAACLLARAQQQQQQQHHSDHSYFSLFLSLLRVVVPSYVFVYKMKRRRRLEFRVCDSVLEKRK